MNNQEKDMSSVCPHCGYPLEIKEHSPDCPNNPANQKEDGEKSSESQVDESELRLFSRENLPEERKRLAEELLEMRRLYYEQKKAVENKLSEIRFLIERKTEEIDDLERKQNELEQIASDKNKTLFSRLWQHSTIRGIDSQLESVQSGIEDRKEAIGELIRSQEEVEQNLGDKKLIEESRRRVDNFYKSHIEDFLEHQEKKRIEELERFEKEEKLRQVERIARDHKGAFLHGIMNKHAPGTNSLLQNGTSFETKLKLAIGLEPTLSTSVIQKGDSPKATWARMGVVISEGRVDSASSQDSATVAKSLSKRTVGAGSEKIADIETSVRGKSSTDYNEFVVSSPKIAGMYYSPEHHGLKSSISEDEFFSLAKNLELPTYVVKSGELFEISLDEESGELIIGDSVDPEKIKENAKIFSEEEKDNILTETLENDMPFRVESILPEARLLSSRSNGIELYLQLQQNKLDTKNLGEKVSVESLGLYPDAVKGKLVGGKVKVIQEVKFPGGATIRYFENNGIIYQQEWDYNKGEFSRNFRQPEDPNHFASEYIRISQNTMKLDKKIRKPENYLAGMEKCVRQALERYNNIDDQDKENKEFYHELLGRLAFHLHGFAETAERYGNKESSEKALAIAEKIISDDDYQEMLERRIDNKGNFKISREDLE
ncbi:MAG: hypothetical protein U5L76_00640 [Patescibacteria group bacterium]|nr:hypothetical protein [Patescibacteria group bacterium]